MQWLGVKLKLFCRLAPACLNSKKGVRMYCRAMMLLHVLALSPALRSPFVPLYEWFSLSFQGWNTNIKDLWTCHQWDRSWGGRGSRRGAPAQVTTEPPNHSLCTPFLHQTILDGIMVFVSVCTEISRIPQWEPYHNASQTRSMAWRDWIQSCWTSALTWREWLQANFPSTTRSSTSCRMSSTCCQM